MLAAIEWFMALGTATANPWTATPGEVAQNVEKLFARFAELYQMTAEQLAFLEKQLAALSSQAAVPLVFQHGDPGPWNMLVTPAGRVALLDWEAAEPQGMPLWDLFYFLRSTCIDAARLAGVRSALSGFVQQFLSETPLSQLVINSVKRYCGHVHLAPQLVEPLFYTCWMHRSLKEATRLAPTKLDSGHYVNLLRLCIAQRNSAVLNCLFAG
jgi:thiamine kinase-like enzyme